MASAQPSLLALVHRVAQIAAQRIESESAVGSLTVRQIQVLSAIDAEEGASQTRLVDQTGIDRSTMADLIKRLVRHGLIARARSKSDARAYSVKLTPGGRRALSTGKPVIESVEEELLAGLPSSKRRELLELLNRVVAESGR